MVILGDPGSGKSSLLNYRALQWANGSEENRYPLPLWVDLKDFAASGRTFLDYLHNAPGSFRLDFREIETRLENGEAAFYLDGLDEIFAPEARHRVIEGIAALSAQHRSAAVVVTSRIVGYKPDRLRDAGFAHATLEDFDDEQTETFLDKWHNVAEPDALERDRLRERLSAALRDSRAIRDLAGNPLLLTMMALVNRNQDLPRDRVELYREASRVLLQEWDTRKALPPDTFGRQEKEALLRRLAGEMQQGGYGLAGNLIDRGRLLAVFRDYLKELGVDNLYGRAQDLVRQLEERNFILCYGGWTISRLSTGLFSSTFAPPGSSSNSRSGRLFRSIG